MAGSWTAEGPKLLLELEWAESGEWHVRSIVAAGTAGQRAAWHRDRFEGLYAALGWLGREAFLFANREHKALTYVSAADPADVPDVRDVPLPF